MNETPDQMADRLNELSHHTTPRNSAACVSGAAALREVAQLRAEAREFVALANTIYTRDRDGRAARRLANRRMGELAPETNSFIVDLHQVEGISESAALLLNQARVNLRADGIAVVFSRLRDRKAIMDPLSRPAYEGDHGFLSFEDNDLAVEWCENRLFGAEVLHPKDRSCLADTPLFQGVDVR